MRSLQLATGFVAAIGVLSALIWFARYSPWAEEHERRLKAKQDEAWAAHKKILQVWADELKDRESKQQQRADENRKLNGRPKIADKPPYPKAEYSENVFDFGEVHVNETIKHTFHIKNVGEGRLLLVECPVCKAPSHVGRRVVEPGAATKIDLSWNPRYPQANFAMTVTLFTNDPLHPEIYFRVFGKVTDGKSQSPSN